MSARSAAARKKATSTHKKAPPSAPSSRSHPRGFVPAEYEYSYPYGQNVQYAQPQHHYALPPHLQSPPLPPPPPESVIGTSSNESQSAPSEAGDSSAAIERSGFRTLLDKRSDDVRKGIAKTFTFRRKDSKDEEIPAPVTPFQRPESSATARPPFLGDGYGYDRSPPLIQSRNLPYYPPQQLQQNPYSPPFHQHQSPTSPIDRWEVSSLGPPPAAELPAVPQSTGPPIKRWVGGGRPPSRWNKLRKDPELWNPSGDVLVYLQGRGHDQPASFRLSSHVIEASENRWLIAELRNSVLEDQQDPTIPTPPVATPGYNSQLGHPTPPVSEADQLDGEISYEMHFPAPKPLSRQDKIQHQITTRNVFAMLCHASLVGITLHQALVDLHARLELYRSPGEPDTAGQIITYLSSRAIDDMRNDIESAVAILAWAERPGVRWSEGWREAFLHCAGMYRDGRGSNGCGGLERCADWKYVTPQTRALLERSWLEMRLKVQTAEERLTEFVLPDIWAGATSEFRAAPPVGSAKAAAERFQKMLVAHYSRVYGSWPPPRPAPTTEDEEIWLTRSVARDLQRDFGALYDYLVDREVVWDVSEARAGRKWMMVSSGWNKGFDADIPGMPMTDILIEFDNRLRLPHIPHPYPLLPTSIPPQPPSSGGGGMFRTASSTSVQQKQQAGRERRVALAYTESTNIDALDTSAPSPSDLVDAFSRFEKNDAVAEVDPAMARRGRWVLLYGILQALAPVSVDAPRVKHAEGVSYHLSARLKRPTWSKDRGVSNSSALFGEVRHDMSHCWTTPATWASSDPEGQTDDDGLAEEEVRDGFRRPPRSLPELSEGGSSVRTSSTTRRYYPPQPLQRHPEEGQLDALSPSGPGGVPKSRFFAQPRPPLKTEDSEESTFLTIDDVAFPVPGLMTPPTHALPFRPQRRGTGQGMSTPEIRDFDDEA